MAKLQLKSIKVFVSYSWTSPDHEMLVLSWAERLRGDGIDVVLDKWDLREGQDKYAFMEQMVTNTEITKVVVFSDAAYAKKADNRKGGVGTESQIISKEVYEKVDQQKFIPVVCEHSDGKACLPTFLTSRLYVDFSSPEKVNEEWEKLLRAIYDKPFFKKPPLGKPPTHILEEGGVASRSKAKLLAFRDALVNDKSSFRGLLTDFLDSFLESYEDRRIDFSNPDKPGDELIFESINQFLSARDEFTEFVSLISSYRTDTEPYDQAADFFESALGYNWRPEAITQYNDAWFDNYRFFTYEMFLYFLATLIKYRRYQQARSVMSRQYLLPLTANASPGTMARFTAFCAGMQSMSHRNERLKLNRLDLTADLLKQRATLRALPFSSLSQADVVLLTASLLDESCSRAWYPRTLVYHQFGQTCDLFARAASKQVFEQLKVLFGVASKEEFTTKLEAGFQRHRVNQWTHLTFYSDVNWSTLLNLDRLASIA